MKRSELTPDELAAAVLSTKHRVGAGQCPVEVIVDNKTTSAKVVRVTGNGLGITLWAES